MIDPTKLTKEESDYIICNIFGTKAVKEYFRRSDKAFRQICKGFRPQSLSDEKVCQLVYSNMKTDFISSFMANNIKRILERTEKSLTEIQEEMQNEPKQLSLFPELEEKNNIFTREDALILFFSHSDFYEMPELYFRLAEQPVTEEYLALLKAAIRTAKSNDNQETDSELAETTEQIETLQKEIEALETITEQQQKSYQEKIQDITVQLEQTRTELLTAQNYISELEKAKKTVHTPDLTDIPETPEGFEYTSLCKVSGEYLIRLADIRHGELIPFEPDFNQPLIYGNRDRLFYDRYKLSQLPFNFYGTWDWYAVQNRNDADTDHVHSELNKTMIPIEIMELSCTSTEELIQLLKEGVEFIPTGDRILFTIQKLCTGILCQKKQLEIKEKVSKLKSDIITLNLYQFLSQDILSFGEKKFYRYIRLGTPVSCIRLYSLTDIVRKTVLQRTSWSAVKQKGLQKASWKICREYLEEIITADFYDEIIEKSQCTQEEAETAVKELIQYADTFIDAEDISDDILVSAIQNHQELMTKCAALIETRWKAEHHEQIAEAELELKNISQETARKKQEASSFDTELKRLQSELLQKETLASEVEEKITSRILSAKENAAAFISEMAFCSPVVTSKSTNSNSIFRNGFAVEEESPEEFDNIYSFLGALDEELQEAGVKENAVVGLAYFMYACYRNQFPLLLAGPYGAEIADAFSAVICSKTAAHLYCNGTFQEQVLKDAENSENAVIVIHQPFSTEWISPLLEWISQSEKYCIFVHPFSEDLLIEPNGLMNYMIPVFTELLIDKKPTKNYFGGILKQPFSLETSEKNRTFHSDFMKKLGIRGLQNSLLQTIMKDMHSMLKNQNEEFDFYFCLFPYAYLSGKCAEFMELIQNIPNIPYEMIEIFKAFSGETE